MINKWHGLHVYNLVIELGREGTTSIPEEGHNLCYKERLVPTPHCDSTLACSRSD